MAMVGRRVVAEAKAEDAGAAGSEAAGTLAVAASEVPEGMEVARAARQLA